MILNSNLWLEDRFLLFRKFKGKFLFFILLNFSNEIFINAIKTILIIMNLFFL